MFWNKDKKEVAVEVERELMDGAEIVVCESCKLMTPKAHAQYVQKIVQYRSPFAGDVHSHEGELYFCKRDNVKFDRVVIETDGTMKFYKNIPQRWAELVPAAQQEMAPVVEKPRAKRKYTRKTSSRKTA